MTGPGVSVFSTLDNGCSSDDVVGTWTFQPSSTYTLEDLNQPAVTAMTITTLASGMPQSPTTSPYDTTSGKGTLSTDLMGSSLVDRPQWSTGCPRHGLCQGGPERQSDADPERQPVSKLKSGRYTFATTDQDRKGGVSLHGNVKNVEAIQLSEFGVRRYEEDHGDARGRSLDRLRAGWPGLHAHRFLMAVGGFRSRMCRTPGARPASVRRSVDLERANS